MPDEEFSFSEWLEKTDLTLEQYQGLERPLTEEEYRAATEAKPEEETLTLAEYIQTHFVGPQGERGIQGPRGPRGDKGERGERGAPGADGAQGPPGIDGAPGKPGTDGLPGPQGVAGPTGPKGADGLAGAAGKDGARGPRGLQGARGYPGKDGDKGETGPRGHQGPEGRPGPKGERGPAGVNAPSVPANADPDTPSLRSLGFDANQAAPGNHWHHMPESQHARRHGLRQNIDPVFPREGTAEDYVLTFKAGSPELIAWMPPAAGGTGGGAALTVGTPNVSDVVKIVFSGGTVTDNGGGSVTVTGFQGSAGATGAQGPQGDTGATGATGPQGSAGTPGTTLHAELTDVTPNQHHDPVTLQASAISVLDLATQAIGFDSQAANKIFASPDGGAGTPQFRSMGTADLPTISHAFLSSIGADDHHARDHALTSGVHTGQLPFGSVSGTVDEGQHGTINTGDPHAQYTTTSEAAAIALSFVQSHELTGDAHPEYLTPAEHNAIADGTPHHAPLTIAASGHSVLDLSSQALGFDSQSANLVFAAPNGSSGTPGFRALGTADLPNIPHWMVAATAAAKMTQSLSLTAAGARALSTGGAGTPTVRETTTNKVPQWYMPFGSASVQGAFWEHKMPGNWDAGTVSFRASVSATAIGTFVYAMKAMAKRNGVLWDSPFDGGSVLGTIVIAGSNTFYEDQTQRYLTVSGTPAAGDEIVWVLQRTTLGQSLAATADVHGVYVEYGLNALSTRR